MLLSRLSVQSMPSDGGMDKRDEGRRDAGRIFSRTSINSCQWGSALDGKATRGCIAACYTWEGKLSALVRLLTCGNGGGGCCSSSAQLVR